MINDFNMLPNLKYQNFSSVSIKLLNEISKYLITFKVDDTLIELKSSLNIEKMNSAIYVRFNTTDHTFYLFFTEKLFTKLIADFNVAKCWPEDLFTIRVQYYLEPIINLFEIKFKNDIKIEEVKICSIDPLFELEQTINLSLKFSDINYPITLVAKNEFIEEVAGQLKDLNIKVKSSRGYFKNYSLQTKLSIGSSKIPLRIIKAIGIHDIIYIDNESFKNGRLQVIVGKQRLESESIDLKKFAIIKINDGIIMKKETDKSLIETAEIELDIDFICGHKNMKIAEIENINPGYIFELNQDISSLVSIEVNGDKIGEGRLVEVDNRLGVQVVTLANGQSNIESNKVFEEEKVALCE
jgi:flagellar motor switch/type III secretory pathway protein FliN